MYDDFSDISAGVKHRENLRFARTKIWGVIRNLFRGVGLNLYKLGIIKEKEVCSH